MKRCPTLDELLERLRADVRGQEEVRELFRMVASGERHPTDPPLPENVIILASQAMTILFNHVDEEFRRRKGGDVAPDPSEIPQTPPPQGTNDPASQAGPQSIVTIS